MIVFKGLVGLAFMCSAAGFIAGPIFTRTRSVMKCGHACASRQPLAKRQAPQTVAACLSISQRQLRTHMTATADGEGDTEAAAAAAPRLKRVRRRRKDANSIETPEENDTGGLSAVDEQQPQPPQPPPAVAAAADFESARVAAAAVVDEVRPPAVAPPSVVRQVSQAVNEAPRSVGGTKGTKVRVDKSDDDITERFAGAASAASGAAGDAASAVGDAAKSAIGAAMSVLGQNGEQSGADEFDIKNVPRSGGVPRTTYPTRKSGPDMADLGADIERFRQTESRQPADAGESIASGAKDLISTIITVDFFVVIAFMLWFIAGVVSSYGFSNSFLLDQFNDKWTPVVQPALGVLMAGTIAGGIASKLSESGDDKTR